MVPSTHRAIVTLLRTLKCEQEVGTRGVGPQHSAARDPSTSPWFSQQDISRLDTADRVSKHPVCEGRGSVCFTGLVGG
ncbi:hypothetical protein KOW79_009455 [Hemibagrus wyckioides]|uniref:Uncharacterized protein n=1 Tax=Hemibagrus wyckioides TaxID=337641 RepID=A0A9D3NSP0_9TELE|nr:hypothetical protein KOW79_009455 [Hemibagrus wyckioides]